MIRQNYLKILFQFCDRFSKWTIQSPHIMGDSQTGCATLNKEKTKVKELDKNK